MPVPESLRDRQGGAFARLHLDRNWTEFPVPGHDVDALLLWRQPRNRSQPARVEHLRRYVR